MAFRANSATKLPRIVDTGFLVCLISVNFCLNVSFCKELLIFEKEKPAIEVAPHSSISKQVVSETYESPSISPSTMVMRSACGLLGRPGMRSMSPAMATIISLPQFRMTSRMRMVKPSGEP